MGVLLRWYVNALLKGNPFVVLVTVVAAVGVSLGPFSKALSSGDRMAIGVVALIVLGVVALIAVAIVDRKLNPLRGKPGSGRR